MIRIDHQYYLAQPFYRNLWLAKISHILTTRSTELQKSCSRCIMNDCAWLASCLVGWLSDQTPTEMLWQKKINESNKLVQVAWTKFFCLLSSDKMKADKNATRWRRMVFCSVAISLNDFYLLLCYLFFPGKDLKSNLPFPKFGVLLRFEYLFLCTHIDDSNSFTFHDATTLNKRK